MFVVLFNMLLKKNSHDYNDKELATVYIYVILFGQFFTLLQQYAVVNKLKTIVLSLEQNFSDIDLQVMYNNSAQKMNMSQYISGQDTLALFSFCYNRN